MRAQETTPFGELLRQHRLAAALSQEALAERAGLSADAIRAIERGRRGTPRPDTVARLVEALGLDSGDRTAMIAIAQGLVPAQPAAPEMMESLAVAAHGRQHSAIQRLPRGSFLGSLPAEPLVARSAELAAILPALDAVAAGEGRAVLLTGEPGVGKTRLAQEVTVEAHGRGFLVVAGSCLEGEQVVPYYPFLDVFAGAYAAAPPELRASLAGRWPYLGALLPNHVPVPHVAGDSDEQLRVLFSGMAFLDVLSASEPIAVLLDDLHWADSASLRLLRYLVQHGRAARILMLGTYRDVAVHSSHPLHAVLSELRRAQLVEQVRVRQLDRGETATLVATLAGGRVVSEEFADLIYRRTDGNPFFVQQVLRTLAERGDTSGQEGRWLQEAIEEEVPESVRSVIGLRVKRLGAVSQEVLHEASVLGQTFPFEVLAGMTQYDEAKLEEGLDEAEAARILREIDRGVYSFDHVLTQQALYHQLSSRRRRRLHRAAAEAIERLEAPQRERRAAEVARHFLEGDEPERAIPYELLAGDRAEAVFAHTEAEAHYRAALKLAQEVGSEPLSTCAYEKLAAPLHRSGRYVEALEALERAAEAYERHNDLASLMPVIAEIGGVHANQGSPHQGLKRMAGLMPRFEAIAPSPSFIYLYASYGSLLFVLGRREEHLQIASRSVDLAERLGDIPALAVAKAQLGLALMSLRRRLDARVVLEEAVTLAERAGDLATLGHALNNAAYLAELKGEFARSISLFERGLQLARQLGNRAQAAFMATAMSRNYLLSGDWRRARDYAEEAAQDARHVGSSWVTPYPVLGLARLAMAEGDDEAAETFLQEGLEIAETNADLQARETACRLLAELELLRGSPGTALQRLHDAGIKEDWDPHRDNSSPGAALIMARVLAALGRSSEAEAMVDTVIAQATQAEEVLIVAAALTVQAELRTGRQDWHGATVSLAEAVRLARDSTYPYAEAQALETWGNLHASRGEPQRARELQEEALSIFTSLGAQRDIERIRALRG